MKDPAGKKLFILVIISEQKLYLIEGNKILKSYPISSSRFGTGFTKDSFKTPLGIHRVYKKIGYGVPLGGVFVGREFTGEIAVFPAEGDLITTRILWLEGLEEGKNRGGEVDTKERFIYIHGTPEEHLLGTPASKGCIRMGNRDIAELFDLVEEETPVLIFP